LTTLLGQRRTWDGSHNRVGRRWGDRKLRDAIAQRRSLWFVVNAAREFESEGDLRAAASGRATHRFRVIEARELQEEPLLSLAVW